MKRNILVLVFTLVLAIVAVNGIAGEKSKKADNTVEANVWTTNDSEKHFICPVMGGEGVVDETTTFSIVDGKKYYHCCAGCSDKLTANPDKFLSDFVIPANVVKVDDAGQHFQCVVSGEMGLVDDKTKFADADGKRYYFCCNSCKTKFEAAPEKFTQSMTKMDKHDHMEHRH